MKRHRTSRRAPMCQATVIGLLLLPAVVAATPHGDRKSVSATAADRSRARPPLPLSAPFEYVVEPFRISPDSGAVSGDSAPFFRESFLLATDVGLVTVFMETPPNYPGRVLWTCNSATGERWSCYQVPHGGKDFLDSADPWLADTRGDPCPKVGSGITLTSTRARSGAGDVGQVVVYHSRDLGATWTQPQPLPESSTRNVNPDGTKIFFSGRTYVGYREFVVGPGQFVNRLGTAADPCAWPAPVELATGDDHPRFAGTPERGGVAVRSADTSVLAGGIVLRFNSFAPDGKVDVPGAPMAISDATLIPAFCTSSGTCRTGADVGQTLLFDPSTGRYHHVYSDRPTPDSGSTLGDLVTRYNFSDDGGLTWSVPILIAGTGSQGSNIGASSVEPTLAYDHVLKTVVLGYYEKPTRDSLVVELRFRTLQNGKWSEPVTVDTTSYIAYRADGDAVPVPKPINGEPEKRFGDYFGLAACGGVAHLSHHPLDSEGKGLIAYTAVRYASPAETDQAAARRDCPALPAARAAAPAASATAGAGPVPSATSTPQSGTTGEPVGTHARPSSSLAATGGITLLTGVGVFLLIAGIAARAIQRRRGHA